MRVQHLVRVEICLSVCAGGFSKFHRKPSSGAKGSKLGGKLDINESDLLLHPPSSSPMARSSPPLPVVHAEFIGPENKLFRNYHPLLPGQPCNATGNPIARDSPPEPWPLKSPEDWGLFHSRVHFELADFLFTQNQMPGAQIDKLLDIWAASLLQVQAGAELLFTSHKDLYKSIDDSCLGDIKWNSFQVKYSGPQPNGNILPWMNNTYDVFHHNPREVVHQILANPDLAT
ncbi:hypothetical protein V8E55_011937 [Tylopilus felleus]